ncbi:hypothetical protein, partial [Stenotrophomonas maltophilia]|uniref:hypothetical protein n=1 Tax=Stenotrophomonas maltophilia TaxID=40324 RepID=UPI001954AFCF
MHILSDRGSHAQRISLNLRDIADRLPNLPKHDTARRPRGPIDIPLAELRAIAIEFDRVDASSPGRTGG